MPLKRKIYNVLKKWKKESNGSRAILIEGARRVGKSYIVKEFAQNEYKSSLIIDFSTARKAIKDLFENETYDLDSFFMYLSVVTGVKFYERNTLIVFDEVQLYPRARQMIKSLVEDGRYDYIETGSLISIKRNIQDILIPSEEKHITLNPMDFEEFLWALGDDVTMPYIKKCFETLTPLGEGIHRKVIGLFRQYMIVGGMPQAVKQYATNKDFQLVDEIKRDILELYRSDIAKYATGYENKVRGIFDDIPAQLSRHEKRFKLSSLGKGTRFRNYEDAFMWLDEAEIINICFNNMDPNVGLGLNVDRLTLKCYMSDTGLLFSHAFSDREITEKNVYKSILFDRLNLNEGMFFENIVAQMLNSCGNKLFFYNNFDRSDSQNNMEIDFLIRRNLKICPIEVKSSSYSRHASIDKFIAKYKNRIGNSYIIYTKDLKVEKETIYLPVYMTSLL
ncbi:MAG: ATP-binding protein [Lachnospiraceae bacterium]|jgi:predicted AAA+ superfamily ATPase|nr:ATP-binding protein [Lachnospiraceae bacterium]